MIREIGEISRGLSVPEGTVLCRQYGSQVFTEERILQSMGSLAERMADEAVFFGGQTIHPAILGYRSMRKPSNDIDVLSTEKGIAQLVDNPPDDSLIYFSPDQGYLFMDFGGLPVSISTTSIHDWRVPEDFRESALMIETSFGPVKAASPEYTIAMKIRRGHCQGRVYGKDRLDISNLLLAPKLVDGRKDIDFRKVAGIIYDSVTKDFSVVSPILDTIVSQRDYLAKRERQPFVEQTDALYSAIAAKYSAGGV